MPRKREARVWRLTYRRGTNLWWPAFILMVLGGLAGFLIVHIIFSGGLELPQLLINFGGWVVGVAIAMMLISKVKRAPLCLVRKS